MPHREWPANDYAIGSYIQEKIAEPYLRELALNPTDSVLDIGCGDGGFTSKIMNQIPHGQVLGIDISNNMVQLASTYKNEYPNFSVQQGDVMAMTFSEQFDCILSFWCLQWSHDIVAAFSKIYKALKNKGALLVLCPTGEGGPYSRAYSRVKESGQFDELAHFTIPPGYNNFTNLPHKLADLPFTQLHCERILASIVLPSLDVFSRYVRGMVHFHNQLPLRSIQNINAAIVAAFDDYCQQHYQGEYRFELAFYKITALK
ncbi:class I SAM-dependent methyltransferase [Legionella maioricensis]|uniref:Class I SAM-dependent methyltransferase n=1 Tax=Legionella maioricensis TaxID=2896528 RepID=A0A9X2I8R4_9GAMM|nr:class I SAM-dependent methyltransferase [Legionella maioricensis]MCL9682924.1 class I SAM-dependent methyltransferase [Legionella maioricensis]MCL9689113.1 class I SAM-dependent methyltransferase [Legionella maioricensis]